MERRQAIKYIALAGGSFVVNLGVFSPRRADAFLMFILGNPVLRFALGMFLRGGFASARRRDREWWDDRLEVQLAQRKLLERSFTDVTVAEVQSPQYSVVVGAERFESLGYNPALSFPRIENDRATVSNFSGAASLGMAIAAQYLAENTRMSIDEIQASILPRLRGGANFDDWRDWSSSSFRGYPNTYSDTGVLVRYDAIDPYSGGYGTIDVTIEANRRIRVPQIRVEYA